MVVDSVKIRLAAYPHDLWRFHLQHDKLCQEPSSAVYVSYTTSYSYHFLQTLRMWVQIAETFSNTPAPLLTRAGISFRALF